jgi:hypothetical protein
VSEIEPTSAEQGGSAEGVRTPHPIRLVVTDDLVRSRLTVLLRMLLAIPHFLWLALWSIGVFVVVIVAWLAALFTGRVPDALHRFMAAYVRYSTHVTAYFTLTANPFPGFDGSLAYPIDVEIAGPVAQSRLTVFFRLLLAIPASIVSNVLQNVLFVLAFLAWFVALFTARIPKGMRDLMAYCVRYQAQTYGYTLLLTQRYPSFSDD